MPPKPIRRELTIRIPLICTECGLKRRMSVSSVVARRFARMAPIVTLCPSCGFHSMQLNRVVWLQEQAPVVDDAGGL